MTQVDTRVLVGRRRARCPMVGLAPTRASGHAQGPPSAREPHRRFAHGLPRPTVAQRRTDGPTPETVWPTLSSWASALTSDRTASTIPPPRHALHHDVHSFLEQGTRGRGIDPYTYLVDVLQRVESHPVREMAPLTPRVWKEHFAADPLRSAIDRPVANAVA